jgi:hypothetical protein
MISAHILLSVTQIASPTRRTAALIVTISIDHLTIATILARILVVVADMTICLWLYLGQFDVGGNADVTSKLESAGTHNALAVCTAEGHRTETEITCSSVFVKLTLSAVHTWIFVARVFLKIWHTFLLASILGYAEIAHLVSSGTLERVACWPTETSLTVANISWLSPGRTLRTGDALTTAVAGVRIAIIFGIACFVANACPDPVRLDQFVITFVAQTSITIVPQTIGMSRNVVGTEQGAGDFVRAHPRLPWNALPVSTVLVITYRINSTDFRLNADVQSTNGYLKDFAECLSKCEFALPHSSIGSNVDSRDQELLVNHHAVSHILRGTHSMARVFGRMKDHNPMLHFLKTDNLSSPAHITLPIEFICEGLTRSK